MNFVEVDSQRRQCVFLLSKEIASDVKFIQVAEKEVPFTKREIENDRVAFILDIQGNFPTNIFYEIILLNGDDKIISYEVQEEAIVPFTGSLPGIILLDNERMYVKFIHVNELFESLAHAPIIYEDNKIIREQGAYTSISLPKVNIGDWRNALIIATQKETKIQQLIPIKNNDSELMISNQYTTGLFEIELIIVKNDHVFRVSFTTNKDRYIALINQSKQLVSNDRYMLSLDSYEGDCLILQLDNLDGIKLVKLLTDNSYEIGEINGRTGQVLFHNVSINNVKRAVLLLTTEEQVVVENLKEGALKDSALVYDYIDETAYNFHVGYLANKEKLSVKNIQVNGTKLSFHINQEDINSLPSHSPFLLLKFRKKAQVYYTRGRREGEHFVFDFSSLLDVLENDNTARCDFYLINDYKNTISYHLHYFEDNSLEGPFRFFQPFEQEFTNNSTYKQRSRVYITQNNELALVKNNVSNLVTEKFNIKLSVINFNMKRNKVELDIRVISPYMNNFQIGSFYLIQRNKDTIDKRSFATEVVSEFNGKTVIRTSVDLVQSDLYPLYWDLYIGVIESNKEHFVKINSVVKRIIKDVNVTISKYQFNVNDKDIIYPYITLSNALSFTYREKEYYENRYYLLKENLAYFFVKLFSKHYEKRNIWLAFEKLSLSAHDSGYYFFDYVYKNKKHDEFYYIIRKDSPEMKNLKDKKDKVIYFMSFKYFVYMFASQLLISSDTKRNSYNLKLKKSRLAKILTHKKLVYLQHGVNGLKKVRDFHKNRGVFDLVIAPSEFEKQMIINDWGYDESEVAATGLARWDGLKDKTKEIEYKQIFLMPTWRTWMDGMEKSKFKDSEYYQKYNEFLSSKKLHALLEEHNIKLKFFLHPKFREYIDLFETDSPNIEKFGFLEVPMDEMIMQSSLMISDYSSVIWEMFYLKKPCVFFHFDKDKYVEYEGTYMDLNNDLFGDVAYDTSELLKTVEHYINNGFEERDKFAELRNEYFTFMDNRNSERIYQAIQENEDWLIKPLELPKFKFRQLLPFSVKKKLLKIKNSILK
ncbi:CDP-glycerol glycerophosphotransferase family protein [Alkalihalobacillus sp. 1P02AB]|uniref:CDP-glycerol glycerophosphotransferase family protein n=1 Tax=Alkalihalobacillus sp. 1P02AB TaxID=3132260 RepID=UPI0039A547DC